MLMQHLSAAWIVLPYIVLPVAVARFATRGTWQDIRQAYGLWIGLLALIGFAVGGARGEGYGWMLIIAMFTTIFAIPTFVFILKICRRLTQV